MYPQYRVANVTTRGRKVTVKLTASTRCGEDIDAKSTVQAKNLGDVAIADAARQAEQVANRNLGHEHDSVVRSCKRRGQHNH